MDATVKYRIVCRSKIRLCRSTYIQSVYRGKNNSSHCRSACKNYFKAEGAEKPLEDYTSGDKIVPWKIVARYKGSELVGMRYQQLMPWVRPCERLDANCAAYVGKYANEHPETIFTVGKDRFVQLSACAFRVIPGDYVTIDDGTGIVHIAPTFGADDAKVAKAAGVPPLFMINHKGETRPMVDLTGKYYTLEELDETFIEKCVDVAAYSHHAGDYVKNAFDPRFNEDGIYDAAAQPRLRTSILSFP